jgi:hypothetical protein
LILSSTSSHIDEARKAALSRDTGNPQGTPTGRHILDRRQFREGQRFSMREQRV